jgi:crotonobetainyl-CoA:carnitine CoA-transferase CaiB-like acyl-CoA transferase
VSYLRRYKDTEDTSIASAPPPGEAELFTDHTPPATDPRKSDVGNRSPKAARSRDELFDALATATGRNPREMTEGEMRACAVALASIRKASPAVTADEIKNRAANYQRMFPHAALTPHAIANHWSALGANAPRPRPPKEKITIN